MMVVMVVGWMAVVGELRGKEGAVWTISYDLVGAIIRKLFNDSFK